MLHSKSSKPLADRVRAGLLVGTVQERGVTLGGTGHVLPGGMLVTQICSNFENYSQVLYKESESFYSCI